MTSGGWREFVRRMESRIAEDTDPTNCPYECDFHRLFGTLDTEKVSTTSVFRVTVSGRRLTVVKQVTGPCPVTSSFHSVTPSPLFVTPGDRSSTCTLRSFEHWRAVSKCPRVGVTGLYTETPFLNPPLLVFLESQTKRLEVREEDHRRFLLQWWSPILTVHVSGWTSVKGHKQRDNRVEAGTSLGHPFRNLTLTGTRIIVVFHPLLLWFPVLLSLPV